MDITTVERHKTRVQQGTFAIRLIILTFCLTLFKPSKSNNGEFFFSLLSELYFLIAKFLLESPFKDAAQVRNDARESQKH
jgi:hypothetical protein